MPWERGPAICDTAVPLALVAPGDGTENAMQLGRFCESLAVMLACAAAGAGLGCSGGGETGTGGATATTTGGTGGGGPASDVQYYRDAKPILDAKCGQCHVEGGIAPFTLGSYDDAKAQLGLIKASVVSKTMPPWPPNDACADYVAARSLSQDQIDVITKWVDGGGVAGDPKDEGKPIPVDTTGALSRVDLNLPIPVTYTQVDTPDDYHCFVLDWPYDTVKYVSGFGANPGDPRVVHHVIAFLVAPSDVPTLQGLDDKEAGPGYTCFGSSGINANEWLGAWAPGSPGQDFPPGTGIRVEPGSKIALQIHYNSLNAGPQPDKTSIDFKIDDSVVKEGKIQPWANPQWLDSKKMDIPAGMTDVEHHFAYDPSQFLTGGEPFTIYSSNLHMHTLGTRAKMEIQHAEAETECLLQIDDWNFHWQGSYGFQKPKTFHPGDKLYLECHWDNSAGNQSGAPKDTWWGEGTTDEMCLGGFYWTK